MRLEPTLNVMPEGSLTEIPTVIKRKTREQVPEGDLLGTSSETTYMEIPNTRAKTIHKSPTSGVPKSIQGTKEASRAEVLASTRQFFAAVESRNVNVPAGNQLTSIEVHERNSIEVPDAPTTTVATAAASTTTPPITIDVELRGTSSPRISLPKGSPSHPTVTTTCRPRTWMQQLTEGQTNEPRREDISSSESNTSVVETLPEDIPDELGHEWRVLHPFDLPGVRFPTDTMPSNQRRLAKNDALVELIQTTEYLDDVPTWGQRDYRLYPLQYGDPFYRGRGRGRGRGRRESGFRKGKWIDLMEDLAEDMFKVMIQEHNNRLPQIDHKQLDRKMNGLHPLMLREGTIQRGFRHHKCLHLLPLLPQKKGYLPTGVVKALQEKG